MIKLSFIKISIFFFLTFVFANCKSSKNDVGKTESQVSENYLVFLDKDAAAKQICQDKTDGFFAVLSIADMSIQLKQSDMPASGGESMLRYKDLLRSDMEDFTANEKSFMEKVFQSTKSALDEINANLMPSKIELIKTKTNHYGPDVYYTREDAIILPNNIFEDPSIGAQMPVMLHEIFHILSRYNEDFREKMYALIGFSKYDENLVLPSEITGKLLTNPDGVSRKYAINLKDDKGVEQLALPLILSTKDRYEPSMPSFFAYLSFDLYPLIKISANEVTLGLNSKGESALSIGHNGDFFEQIKDNTQYIIHPDEIMADNFMMAVIANQNNTFEGFSEEGKKLLLDVLEILKTFEK
jgi:hypothetical protein